MTDRDLDSIIYRGAESRNFEYKGPMRWDPSDIGCAGLVADVLAMANSGGGHIVIGVAEDGSSPTGWDWQGIERADVSSWDQTKFGEVLRQYSGASVEFSINRVALRGDSFVVLTVAPFRKHPFICIKSKEKDGEKGGRRFALRRLAIYVRTEEAQTVELHSPEHYQELIELAIRQRRDELLAAFSSVLAGRDFRSARPARDSFDELTETIESALDQRTDVDLRGCYIDVMFPAVYSEGRYTLPQLEQAVGLGARQVGHSLFVRPPDHSTQTVRGNDSIAWIAIWQTPFGMHEHFEYWELLTSGMLFAAQRMWEEAVSRKNQTEPYLMPDSVIEHVAGAIDGLVGVYSGLGMEGEEITWKLKMTGTQGRHIAFPSDVPPPPGGFKDADAEPITWEHTAVLEEWSANRTDIGYDVCQHIFDRFYWRYTSETETRAKLDALLWGKD